MSLIPASYIEKSWRKAMCGLVFGSLEFTAPNGEVTLCKGTRPGPHASFRLHDWEVLRKINPKLIYASGTGYGLSGPSRDNLAMDLTVQAASGMATASRMRW